MTELEAQAYVHVDNVLREAMRQKQSLGCCWQALVDVQGELAERMHLARHIYYGDGDWDCVDEKPDLYGDDQ